MINENTSAYSLHSSRKIMLKRTLSTIAEKNRKLTGTALVFTLLIVFFCATTRFDLDGPLEGLYLLKGENGHLFEVKHDILLGEYQRLIGKVEFEALYARWRSETSVDKGRPYLKYQWHEKGGRGYFVTFFPDGSKFLACFGRFVDDGKKAVKGLFVGGGLPYSHYENAELKMNETGVAIYNGREWHHLWCNANEAIFPASDPRIQIPPSNWEFLGSRVIFASQYQLIIKSSHLVRLDTVPVRVDRYMIYHAGDRFFTLVNRLTNIGNSRASYCYVYGDEPWVGDYGTSIGNVGWTRDRLYYYESHIDLTKYNYAGIYDYGNPVIHEKSAQFTGLANFIEWQGDALPDLAYFSNRIGVEPSDGALIPLSDKSNRVLMLQWAYRQILPGQSEQMVLTIGMADNDPKTGFPLKPDVRLDAAELHYLEQL